MYRNTGMVPWGGWGGGHPPLVGHQVGQEITNLTFKRSVQNIILMIDLVKKFVTICQPERELA